MMRRLLSLMILLAATTAQAGKTDQTFGPSGWSDTLPGHEGTYYFFRGLDYGSQHLIHPLRLIINGGYGILAVDNRDNRPGKVAYATGMVNVSENLINPFWAITKVGFWDFLSTQVIPISINSGRAQYWPNYMNHLLGGGMSYRMMEEYYRYHGWHNPKGAALSTLFVYHFLNEVVENNDYRGPSDDPVADFWIFNPAGILLFSNDTAARFFSETLHMTDWSYQPMMLPINGELFNQGQNYAVKYHLNNAGSASLFYHWGGHAELGMSFTDSQGRCVSWGLGLVAKNLVDIDTISKTLDLAASAGVFYDRHNSLLASLLFARTKDFKWRLNLYPGLVELGPFKPGFLVAVNRDDDITLGLTFGSLQHLPFGLGGRPQH
ncbi:hypothetical protein DRQ50_11675 [bacterium]|nr:MAG: hypothetical protein DRQ50_11675 [bacterium]